MITWENERQTLNNLIYAAVFPRPVNGLMCEICISSIVAKQIYAPPRERRLSLIIRLNSHFIFSALFPNANWGQWLCFPFHALKCLWKLHLKFEKKLQKSITFINYLMFVDNEARENEWHENENKSKCSMNVVKSCSWEIPLFSLLWGLD